MMLHIAVIGFVAGEDLVQSHRVFTALLLKAAQVGLEAAVTARAGLGLSLLPLPSRIKPWGAPTFQRTSETSSFHFSHLNGYRIARFTRWLQLGLCWGYGWCLCFGGADLKVLRRAEYQGDRLPRVSTSCKTRLHGRYGGD